MPRELKNCPAPAKLNLFLHIIGRRADGYHLLQSVFQLIDRCDYLDFTVRSDGIIERANQVAGVPAELDLVVRAAQLLQKHSQSSYGATITLHKNLPMGGGVGGGSSDAATTLLALNHLWNCQLSTTELMQLGLQLGADVPFFIFGSNAFVEGIGEQLQEVQTPEQYFLVIEPGVNVPTPSIFSAKELTRDTKAVRITDFPDATTVAWKNDMQAVACTLHSEIKEAIDWLSQFQQESGNLRLASAKMTGSGSCVFCGFETEKQANEVCTQVPKHWKAWVAKALQQHPMKSWLQN
ncbi:4-(cytidine 5'-diphospho)-2-C-methyl-D-erythritol kinase [Undibacterium cyanobacteriorum]|uniref:4-diphosphocytidyl-2-C-methyl-D-erythritol kinase n=1 Tax=Undibacterium cyanobacteriorum TaxID=3073561 RepID=A0ABY9RNA6_9BURK|nr:4-(cytidine 5'-diphospho)-2-C-methyl-D-erythritol kinase [Undibacterium sp. 20NA77.5]WMW81476.1 4-(cytidine 5'-diphospho)-2-C-methyl-D-erythritol kinase [Undibacterium sp. 20NA77.5]